jgi:hypothetical protein
VYIVLVLVSAIVVAVESPVPTRSVTLTPVELASAYNIQCAAKVQPPYAHPAGTVFVGGFTVLNGQIGVGATICPAYQGLVRFDLDGLDAGSIVKASLFYEAKHSYSLDGSSFGRGPTCVGAIGATTQTWSVEQKAIAPTLPEIESMRSLRGNFKSPPIDVTPLLKAHLTEIKANGLLLDGTVENIARHVCLAAVGHIELRLQITGAAQ